MARKAKTERNTELVKKRDEDPIKWSWRKLADHYGLRSRATVKEIYQTTKKRLSTGTVYG